MNYKNTLNIYTKNIVMFNPSDLDDKEIIEYLKKNKFHLYIVCKRKKFYFERSEQINDKLSKTILYCLTDNHDKLRLPFTHPSSWKISRSKQKGYYNIIEGDRQFDVRDFSLINEFCREERQLNLTETSKLPSDLEVVYIGQAFGRKNIRTIDYRLSNHEKVQKIASKIIDEGSSEEILIIGIKTYADDLISIIDEETKQIKFIQTPYLEKKSKSKNRISNGQEVTIYEASLIKYFQPDLNTEYKETFPAKGYSSYEEIYELDYDYLSMVLDTKTEEVQVRLFSEQNQRRKSTHHKIFSLDNKNKKSIFSSIFKIDN